MNPLYLHEIDEKKCLPEDRTWEWYHENSKMSIYTYNFLSSKYISTVMEQMYESIPYEGYEKISLENIDDWKTESLGRIITQRRSAGAFQARTLTLRELSILLHYGYGMTGKNSDEGKPGHRAIPSGGALYPLEVYLYICWVSGLKEGMYHYYIPGNQLTLLETGNFEKEMKEINVYRAAWDQASVILFITASFERSTFKYGERGYRFALMESGHLAQNFNLIATALGLNILNIGGFYDRKADKFLRIDGVKQSTIYMTSIGGQVSG